MKPQPTTEKLAQALIQAEAPAWMIQKARAGHYDDYQSDLINPIGQLIEDAQDADLWEIAERAKHGDFDGTKEESDAWYAKEGQKFIQDMTRNTVKAKRHQRRNR